MTINELYLKLGIDIKMTKEILKGEASIATSISAKLEKNFNIPVSFWNNLENNYRNSLLK